MKPLRAAALVMFTIAAIDFTIDAIEWIINRLTGSTNANLWPILLATGILVIIIDMMFDKETLLGRHTRNLFEKLIEKLRGMLAFLGATTFGTGVIKGESQKSEESKSPTATSESTEPSHEPGSFGTP